MLGIQFTCSPAEKTLYNEIDGSSTRSRPINTRKTTSWEPKFPHWINPNTKLKILSDVWRGRGGPQLWLLPFLALLVAGLACSLPLSLPGSNQSEEMEHPEVDALMEELGISIEEVMADPGIDERPETLELMGAPDAFTLQWQVLQGQDVRWEEWSYFDFGKRFDFVDGVLLWTLDIELAPSGSICAHFYNPLDFEAGMTVDEVQDLLPDIILTEFALDEVDIPGGVMYVGDQILLGFDDGGLVYVQTFILEPEEPLND